MSDQETSYFLPLRANQLSPGKLYYKSTSKKYLLKNEGDLLDDKFIEKYQNYLLLEKTIELQKYEDCQKLWTGLFHSNLRELQLHQKKILREFFQWVWFGKKSGSLHLACYFFWEYFEGSKNKEALRIAEIDQDIFTRNLISASMLMPLLLTQNIFGLDLYRKIFHQALVQEKGAIGDSFNYHNKTELESLLKMKHIEKVIPFSKDEDLDYYAGINHLTSKLLRDGKTRGNIKDQQLDDLQCLYSSIQLLFPLKEFTMNTDLKGFLKSSLSDLRSSNLIVYLPIYRVEAKLSYWANVFDREENEKEVMI